MADNNENYGHLLRKRIAGILLFHGHRSTSCLQSLEKARWLTPFENGGPQLSMMTHACNPSMQEDCYGQPNTSSCSLSVSAWDRQAPRPRDVGGPQVLAKSDPGRGPTVV